MRKKVDERIRTLIENGVKTGHRSMFVIIGDKSRDQVYCFLHSNTFFLPRRNNTVSFTDTYTYNDIIIWFCYFFSYSWLQRI